VLIQRLGSANCGRQTYPENSMLSWLISVLDFLMTILWTVVIVQFILSLLIAFNVVSLSNNIVSSIWQALNVILDPFLRPIRKILPDTGMIDFSPMVLLIGLRIFQMLLAGLANDISMAGM
jgi:YggT family protein